MACPNCGSENVRLAEPGVLENTMFCNDCRKSYGKMSPHAGWQLAAIVLSALTGGLLGGIFSDMDNGGGGST